MHVKTYILWFRNKTKTKASTVQCKLRTIRHHFYILVMDKQYNEARGIKYSYGEHRLLLHEFNHSLLTSYCELLTLIALCFTIMFQSTFSQMRVDGILSEDKYIYMLFYLFQSLGCGHSGASP